MKRKTWFNLITLSIILALGVFGWIKLKPNKLSETHYHAGFQVYINGVLQDYSSDQYMKNEECRVNTTEEPYDPIDRVHLHNNVGDVAHVHESGVLWGDLFQNLNLSLDPSATISAFINGQTASNFFTQPINAYDSLVLLTGTFGDPNSYLISQVTYEHIIETEKLVESCGLN